MSFTGNAEWAACGTSTFSLAQIVLKSGQCNMHPKPELDPKFPNATILILDNVEANHQFYWAHKTTFPNVQIIYLNSHPDSSGWLSNWPKHVVFRFYDDELDPLTIVPPSDKIKRLQRDLTSYVHSDTAKAEIDKRFQVIPRKDMYAMIHMARSFMAL